jgi:hypothetical protein
LLAKISMAPAVPAGRMAAFAVTGPVGSFTDATTGRTCPVGHAVRKPSGIEGTTAKFSE